MNPSTTSIARTKRLQGVWLLLWRIAFGIVFLVWAFAFLPIYLFDMPTTLQTGFTGLFCFQPDCIVDENGLSGFVVIPNSPATRAGIQESDTLFAINGEAVNAENHRLYDNFGHFGDPNTFGAVGTEVLLSLRDSLGEVREVSVIRELGWGIWGVGIWMSFGTPFVLAAGIFVLGSILIFLVFSGSALIMVRFGAEDWFVRLIGIMLLSATVFAAPNIWTNSTDHQNLISQAWLLSEFFTLVYIYLMPDGRFVPKWAWIPMLSYIIIRFFLPEPFASTLNNFPYLIGVALQFIRYRQASPEQRQILKWIFYAIIIVIPLRIMGNESIDYLIRNVNGIDTNFAFLLALLDIMGWLVITVVPLSILATILRYRLWDIDILINRSLVYGAFALFILAIFSGILIAVQVLVGQTQPIVAFIIAGIIAVLAFRPLQSRLQHFVDRRIYGLRFDQNELQAAQERREITNAGVLSGRFIEGYELLGVLGQGGMGEVYKAEGQGKTVAVKTLLPRLAAEVDNLRRFQREAEIGMRLNHRNIAKVYSNGLLQDTPYLVMEYIEGQDLSQRLKEDGAMDEETAITLLEQIAAALEIAHKEGFVHRDLKPSNIMLRQNGEAVLMDFGVSKMSDASSNLTGSGAIGTIDYMAPEQIVAAKEVDLRADIYALGVMSYEMLTGKKLFTGGPAQVMFAHIQQPAPDPQESNPEISYAVSLAVLRALEKDPKDRFDSALAFIEALKA
jgi:tRNA A-37 threonylcarbamoyl transferase component Bud32